VLPKLKILFLCTGNSCRSQMAEGWTRHLHGGRLEAHSAGTVPGRVNPRAIRVMREAGVDISGHRSKHLADVLQIGFDWVVTLCDDAKKNCPAVPGEVRRVHVAFDDPLRLASGTPSEEQALGLFRRVRDEIRDFVEELPRQLAERE
jgi:arsenate reductase